MSFVYSDSTHYMFVWSFAYSYVTNWHTKPFTQFFNFLYPCKFQIWKTLKAYILGPIKNCGKGNKFTGTAV